MRALVILGVSFIWCLGRLRRPRCSLRQAQEYPGIAQCSSWISKAGHEGGVHVSNISRQWARKEDSPGWRRSPDLTVVSRKRE